MAKDSPIEVRIGIRTSPEPFKGQDAFVSSSKSLARQIHETAVAKGWWKIDPFVEDFEGIETVLDTFGQTDTLDHLRLRLNRLRQRTNNRNDGEMIALMHSELSEALEGLRHHNRPDDKIPEFTAVEAELADTMIRILDFAHVRGHRVGEAVIAKMRYNTTREYRHGGKGF